VLYYILIKWNLIMRLDEFVAPELPQSPISQEDEARIIAVAQQGESAWSKPMSLEEAIAMTNKAAGIA
jgi:hypothetical protein